MSSRSALLAMVLVAACGRSELIEGGSVADDSRAGSGVVRDGGTDAAREAGFADTAQSYPVDVPVSGSGGGGGGGMGGATGLGGSIGVGGALPTSGRGANGGATGGGSNANFGGMSGGAGGF